MPHPDYSRMVNSYVMDEYQDEVGFPAPVFGHNSMPGSFLQNQYWNPSAPKMKGTKGSKRKVAA